MAKNPERGIDPEEWLSRPKEKLRHFIYYTRELSEQQIRELIKSLSVEERADLNNLLKKLNKTTGV